MATVAERLAALSADDKALAKRIVSAGQAKALLDELEPKIAALVEESTEAQRQVDECVATQERIRKESSGLRGLLRNRQKKANHNMAMLDAQLGRTEAMRAGNSARGKLATLRKEKAALDKTLSPLRTDAALRQRVAALLAAVFDEPTPDYPAHEELVAAYKAAQATYEEVQGRVSNSATVVNNVSRASLDLRGAIGDIKDAIRMAEREKREAAEAPQLIDWGYASFMSKKSVEYAKKRIEGAEKAFAEAREIDPEVGDMFKPAADEAADEDWASTPISSYLKRHGVKVEVVDECVKKLEQEVERGNSRTDVLAKERDPVLKKYNDLEKQLREMREKILEEASAGPLS